MKWELKRAEHAPAAWFKRVSGVPFLRKGSNTRAGQWTTQASPASHLLCQPSHYSDYTYSFLFLFSSTLSFFNYLIIYPHTPVSCQKSEASQGFSWEIAYKAETCFSAFTATWLRSFQVDVAKTLWQRILDSFVLVCPMCSSLSVKTRENRPNRAPHR